AHDYQHLAGYVRPAPPCAPDRDEHFYGPFTLSRAEDRVRPGCTYPTVRRHTLGGPPYAERGLDPVEPERVLARATHRYLVAGEEKSLAGDRVDIRFSARGFDLACVDVDRRRGLWQIADLARAEVVHGGDVAVPELGLEQGHRGRGPGRGVQVQHMLASSDRLLDPTRVGAGGGPRDRRARSGVVEHWFARRHQVRT